MSPTRYFGSKTKEFGRPLWEILLNLKGLGKGRVVVHSGTVEKYPKEPSFYRVLSAHPHFIQYPETWQGNIWVEEVHRGVKREQPVDIGDLAGLPGFRLLLKEEEEELLASWKKYQENPLPVNVLPRTAPLPPLWKLILKRDGKEGISEIPVQHDPIEPGVGAPRRLAEEGEEPTFRIGPGQWKPKYPQLLRHVVRNREEAREKFVSPLPNYDFIYKDKGLRPVDISDLVEKESKSSSKAA